MHMVFRMSNHCCSCNIGWTDRLDRLYEACLGVQFNKLLQCLKTNKTIFNCIDLHKVLKHYPQYSKELCLDNSTVEKEKLNTGTKVVS